MIIATLSEATIQDLAKLHLCHYSDNEGKGKSCVEETLFQHRTSVISLVMNELSGFYRFDADPASHAQDSCSVRIRRQPFAIEVLRLSMPLTRPKVVSLKTST